MGTKHPMRLGAVAAAVLLAAVTGGCSGGGKADGGGDRIVFGVVAPLSGPSAVRGREIAEGARMAADDLNVEGGVIGRPVDVVTADDGCTAAGAAGGAAKLVANHVAGAVGGICDGEAAAAARALGKARIPFLVTSANAPSIVGRQTTPTAFLTNGTPYQEALATSHWLAISAAQQLAVVTDDAPQSVFLARKVIGLSPPPVVVGRQTVAAAAQDLSAVARKAVRAKPDVVYWAGSPAGAARLVAALRGAGYKGRFAASARSDTPAFLAAAGGSAEGAYVVTTASPQNLPAAAGWAGRFAKAYGHAPGRDALQAYDDLRALAQAVTQTGKVDGPLNSKQLAFLDDSYTTFLRVGLQFARDHTPQEDNHVVLRVRNGAFRLATPLRSQHD